MQLHQRVGEHYAACNYMRHFCETYIDKESSKNVTKGESTLAVIKQKE